MIFTESRGQGALLLARLLKNLARRSTVVNPYSCRYRPNSRDGVIKISARQIIRINQGSQVNQMVIQQDRNQKLAQKLDLSAILNRSRDDDRVMLDDHLLLAALDGSRPLNGDERELLQQSPQTLLRFRQLALQARARKNAGAANDAQWQSSMGCVRDSDEGSRPVLQRLKSDDQYWSLQFIADEVGWQLILSLSDAAPFAQQIKQAGSNVRLIDGAGAILLEGSLDIEGECEVRWPYFTEPELHLRQAGARFRIELA